MTVRKLTISLAPPVAEALDRAVAEGRAPSASAYIAAALEEKAKLDDLEGLLAEMLAETGGPITETERAAADQALGLTDDPATSARP